MLETVMRDAQRAPCPPKAGAAEKRWEGEWRDDERSKEVFV